MSIRILLIEKLEYIAQSCQINLQAQKKALAKASAFFNEAHLVVHEK